MGACRVVMPNVSILPNASMCDDLPCSWSSTTSPIHPAVLSAENASSTGSRSSPLRRDPDIPERYDRRQPERGTINETCRVVHSVVISFHPVISPTTSHAADESHIERTGQETAFFPRGKLCRSYYIVRWIIHESNFSCVARANG